MQDKHEILQLLRDEFARWDELFSALTTAEIESTVLPGGLTYGDLACHLWAWQTRSVARVEAALEERAPDFTRWPAHLNPDEEADLEPVNAWIRGECAQKTWQQAYGDWRETFLRLIALVEAVPEAHLLEAGRYPWLWGHALALIPTASCNHHREEHYEPLMAWRAAGQPPESA